MTSFIAKGLLPYRGLGTGVRRALEEWPKINFIDDRDGCLFNAVVQRLNAPVNAHLSKLQLHILEILSLDPAISYEELFIQLAKDRSTIRRNIKKLKLQGVLRRLGSDKNGSWEVVHNAPARAPVNIRLSDLQIQILEILKQDPSISYEELFLKLEKDRSTIRRNIQKLKVQRLLRRLGSDKTGLWEVAHNAPTRVPANASVNDHLPD